METNKLKEAASRLVNDILAVKAGESVAITCDPATDREMIKEIAQCIDADGAFPIILETYPPDGQTVLKDDELPVEVLSAALTAADVWIEINQRQLLYTTPFENALEKNDRLRYIVLAEIRPDVLIRTIGEVDVKQMKPLLLKIKELLEKSKTVRITSRSGTDVICELDDVHPICCGYGDGSVPGFHTMPGDVNIVPRFGSVNGKIIFDGTLTGWGILGGERTELIVKDGVIEEIRGTEAAEWFRNYLKNLEDPNMYKMAHVTIGLNPGAIFSGSTPEDERVWGVTTWGIGAVPAEDAPPHGQEAVSHCDGTCSESTIWLDDRKIMERGRLVDEELKKLDFFNKQLHETGGNDNE